MLCWFIDYTRETNKYGSCFLMLWIIKVNPRYKVYHRYNLIFLIFFCLHHGSLYMYPLEISHSFFSHSFSHFSKSLSFLWTLFKKGDHTQRSTFFLYSRAPWFRVFLSLFRKLGVLALFATEFQTVNILRFFVNWGSLVPRNFRYKFEAQNRLHSEGSYIFNLNLFYTLGFSWPMNSWM